MGKGRAVLEKGIPEVLAGVAERLPAALIDTLREQWNGLTKLDEQIAGIERRMRERVKENAGVKAISEIPGVGLLTATAAVGMIGSPKVVVGLAGGGKNESRNILRVDARKDG